MNSYISGIVRGYEILTLIEMAFPDYLSWASQYPYDTHRIVWEYRLPLEEHGRVPRNTDNFSGYVSALRKSHTYVLDQPHPDAFTQYKYRRYLLSWYAGVAPVSQFFSDVAQYVCPHGFSYTPTAGSTFSDAYLGQVESFLTQWGYRNTKDVPRRRSVEKAIKRGIYRHPPTKLGG